MSLLLPDELLESLSCSCCHKFLSVGPVKVYENKEKKCGRCTENEEDGVVSFFEKVGKQSLFKCVNRFDGCRKLLRYSQVRFHEIYCRSREYVCPKCPVSIQVPTYLMIKHFQEIHPNALLEGPNFNIDTTEWSANASIFLHRKENRLFFISLRVDTIEEYISLKVFLLGDKEEAEYSKYTFFITKGSEPYGIRTVADNCVPYGSGNFDEVRVDLDGLRDSQMINVEFKLVIDIHDNFLELPSSLDHIEEWTNTDSTQTYAVPAVRKVDKWTNTDLFFSLLLNIFECISIWINRHEYLTAGFIILLALLMYMMEVSEKSCLETLKRERQVNSECMRALQLQRQKSCFLF
nr:uncharacterized protein LOC111509238 [Leptinotarsa decemlineata]